MEIHPFSSPFRRNLVINLALLAAQADGVQTATVSYTLPPGAIWQGAWLGSPAGFVAESVPVAFVDPGGNTWSADLHIVGASDYGEVETNVGPELTDPLPAELAGTPPAGAYPIGGAVATLTVTIESVATPASPAVIVGDIPASPPPTFGAAGDFDGLSLTISTDSNPSPTIVLGSGVGAPASYADVAAQITAATGADPVATVNGDGQLVLTSASTGDTASVAIASGSRAALLGYGPSGKSATGSGTPIPAAGVNTATAGHIEASIVYAFAS